MSKKGRERDLVAFVVSEGRGGYLMRSIFLVSENFPAVIR